jgi:hypothetical protein
MKKFDYSKFKSQKSQSAMEYLMTYGWAILIIAIVLVALFSLGVFNSANFAPRAQPGSCQVIRTAAQVSLAGQCNGMLPEYVAQFNGQSSYVTLQNIAGQVAGLSALTVSVWVDPKATFSSRNELVTDCSGEFFLSADASGNQEGDFCVYTADSWDCYAETTQKIVTNNYQMITGTYNSTTGNVEIYYDGQAGSHLTGVTGVIPNMGGSATLAYPQCDTSYFDGTMANVQIYNTSLSANDIQALYQEGIGGAPINVNNLVGWWPLNGNANDYSGNGNSGNATNVIYTSAWTSGYSTP